MQKLLSLMAILGIAMVWGNVYASSDAQCNTKYPETIYDSSTETCVCPTDKPLGWNKYTYCGFMNGAVKINVKQINPEVKKTIESKKTISTLSRKESKVIIRLKDKKCKKQDSNSYYDSTSKKCIINNNETTSNKVSSTSQWTEVTYKNHWNRMSDYNFANINFSYPTNWDFQCCSDMGHASDHIIFSKSSNWNLPYIVITDYVLAGCPNNTTCGLEEIVKKTPKEKYDELVNLILSNKGIRPVTITKINSNKLIKNLNISAFNYQTVDEKGVKSDLYIINTNEDVLEISFNHFDLLSTKFIEEFLEKIKISAK